MTLRRWCHQYYPIEQQSDLYFSRLLLPEEDNRSLCKCENILLLPSRDHMTIMSLVYVVIVTNQSLPTCFSFNKTWAYEKVNLVNPLKETRFKMNMNNLNSNLHIGFIVCLLLFKIYDNNPWVLKSFYIRFCDPTIMTSSVLPKLASSECALQGLLAVGIL